MGSAIGFAGSDGRHRHGLDLDISAGLIGVELYEHIADAQCRALVMDDDNLDFLHVDHDVEDDGRRRLICWVRVVDRVPARNPVHTIYGVQITSTTLERSIWVITAG